MNKKGTISLILAVILITGTPALTACDSNGKDDAEATSEYDGTWYVISDDFAVLSISGDVLEYYEYDFGEKRFIPAIWYFEEYPGKEYTFDSKTGTLMVSDNAFIMEVDGNYSILRNNDEDLTIGLYRVDSSVQDLRILELQEGVWYTEDRGYGILIRGDDASQRLNVAQFSITEKWNENWYENGSFFNEKGNYVYFQKYSDNVRAYFEIRDCIFLSDGSMIDFMEFDYPAEYLGFEYTLNDNQLTLSGLDKKNMWVISDEKEMPFPVSELTFVYHGEYSVE